MRKGEGVFPIAPGTFLRSRVTRLIFAVALALEIAIMGLFMADVMSAPVARRIGISVAALSLPMLINVWIHLHGRLCLTPKELRYEARFSTHLSFAIEDVASVQVELETGQPAPVGSVEIRLRRRPRTQITNPVRARTRGFGIPLLLSKRYRFRIRDPDRFVELYRDIVNRDRSQQPAK
jgi:hypothetical protein